MSTRPPRTARRRVTGGFKANTLADHWRHWPAQPPAPRTNQTNQNVSNRRLIHVLVAVWSLKFKHLSSFRGNVETSANAIKGGARRRMR